ncbi:UDP-N-acetylmuramoyl-L-alanine--D-glutamate ligase [soil metagenome]|nr:UDP-N-acetylmuramoyl-L-alanine--D-glutamate ligase [Acidobacteriota bacterium]
MTTPREFSVRGKQVTVVGAARSGLAAAGLLVRRGARVTLSDRRPAVPEAQELESQGITLELGAHHASTFVEADLVVVSPGVPWRIAALEAARAAGVPVIGELELAARWLRGRIVAITGTKGKSTTTVLAGRMLEAGGRRVLVGGNIGLALSAQVEQSTDDTIHVVETSSFQLEAADTFHPWIAVLLNFSPDHLDRHATEDEYAAAKARIFANQTAHDWAVLNADDPSSLRVAASSRAQRVRFSVAQRLDEGFSLEDGLIVRRRGEAAEPLVPVSAVRLLGRHLLADVMAAAAVADIAGVEAAAMTRAVEAFTGLEHALEPVAEIGGVRFVNDSKATNIEAAQRAIECFDDGLVVIMGGRYKGGEFRDLGPALQARRAAVVAIGEARERVRQALSGVVPVRESADMAAAVRTAFTSAAPGSVVLLAPACSSFDMFGDYEERGRVFRQEVWRLQEEWDGTREQ